MILRSLLKPFNYLREFTADFSHMARFGTNAPMEELNRRIFYKMLITTHAIEKGLSLPSPRPFFGEEKLRNLMAMLLKYEPTFSTFPLEMASGAIEAYLLFHRNAGMDSPFLQELQRFLETTEALQIVKRRGGLREKLTPPSTLDNKNRDSWAALLTARFSCRSYQKKLVPEARICSIIKLAQSAPSQCNRQSVRVHCFQSAELIGNLLRLQSGATGMEQSVHNLFIVTFESTAWTGLGQRNQGYADGGLFAQQLMLACHINGIASCALNLAMQNRAERALKQLAGIHERERLVVMLAFGYAQHEDLKAARSPRRPTSEVLVMHDNAVSTDTRKQQWWR